MEILADLISLVLWYAYPAFLCYRAVRDVEENRAVERNGAVEENGFNIVELRLWCEYWIIVAVLTILVMIGDKFILGFPMYRGWAMLALFYWTYKRRADIYGNVLRPFIDQNLQPKILRISQIFHLDALFARIEIFYPIVMVDENELYEAVMTTEGFAEEMLVLAFNYMKKEEKFGRAFMARAPKRRKLWLENYFSQNM